MGELIVISGPPGAGKSSVAELLVNMVEPSALVSGDVFFAFVRRGFVAPWLPQAEEQNAAVVEAAATTAGVLSRRHHVVYDGLIGPWFLTDFARRAARPQLHYVVLLPALDVCLERVRSRTGHGFTDLDAARQMHAEFTESTIDTRHLIADVGPIDTIAAQAWEMVRTGVAAVDLGDAGA